MSATTSRSSGAIGWLRVLLAMSLIGPLCLYTVASWLNYQAAVDQARETVARLADVLREHALRTIKINDIAVIDTLHEIRGLDDEAIGRREREFHDALTEITEGLPEKQGLWIYDRAGHPLATSAFYPIDKTLDLSSRDYFVGLRDRPESALFISGLHHGGLSNTDYFSIARPRLAPDGSFNGVVISSITPDYFSSFYERASPYGGFASSLIRLDGVMLARFPPLAPDQRLPAASPIALAIAEGRLNGDYEAASSIVDGEARIVSYRQIGDYPMVVAVAVARSAVLAGWRSTMASHLVFGLPATIALFVITLLALRGTRREMNAAALLRSEAERRETAEAALHQVQKLEAIGQLTGGIAHDFNNLLTVINGNLELLENATGERAKRLRGAIAQAASRGERLTRQLLTFSRRQALQPRPVDLRKRLPGLGDMLRRSLRGDIACDIDTPTDLWPVEIDPAELELALLNLAVNARDAMPSGGAFKVIARNVVLAERRNERTGLAGEFVALDVSDDGCGMGEEVLARVFEPFFTTKDVGKGTGLGLSQVYGFVNQSGGAVTIRSTLGAGTTVSLYLPRSRSPVPADSGDGAPDAMPPATDRRALLVEDNPQVAEITEILLGDLGFVVSRVESVRQALDLLEKDAGIDLVLSDIIMAGGLNGLDLAREVRSRYPELPVVLMTGYSESATEAKREGFVLVQKPFRRADLDRALQAVSGGGTSPLAAGDHPA